MNGAATPRVERGGRCSEMFALATPLIWLETLLPTASC
jgi:hypothetical protein